MSIFWRNSPRDPNTPRKKPGPPATGMSATSLQRRKHTAGLARKGYLDEIVTELCRLFRGCYSNQLLKEVLRINDRKIKLLDITRLSKVMQVYGEQRSRNDRYRRAADKERAELEARVDRMKRLGKPDISRTATDIAHIHTEG